MYLLALGRLPEVAFKEQEGISPRLQSVLDGFELCPAFVQSSTWDVVGWNSAAAAVLTDYGALEKAQRNVLRLMFLYPLWQLQFADWKDVARAVVALFRADVVRTGASDAVKVLVDETVNLEPGFQRNVEQQ